MIKEYDFRVDEENREQIAGIQEDFSCVCKRTDFSGYIGGTVQWHWHPAFEINYISEGTCRISTPNHAYQLDRGEAIFVNSNVMHTLEGQTGANASHELSVLFHADFLSGLNGSLLEKKYIRPIAECDELEALVIRGDHEAGVEMLARLHRIHRIFQDEAYGYEVTAHNTLWEFWLLLMGETAEIRSSARQGMASDNESIKKMLKFVHSHYAETIYLTDIARAGAVSERECSRCFRKYVKMSPNAYLNYYRLRAAARRLLQDGTSITRISEESGFGSVGYFERLFRREFGMPPNQYRGKYTT